MRHWLVSTIVVLLATSSLPADPPDLAFKPADKEGYFQFDTGALRGGIRLDGKWQGIEELVHVASGVKVAQGGKLPGLFSYYRVFSTDTRYGHAARDWPTVNKILPDGALQVHWPPAEDHPLEMTAIYRWSRPEVLDVETIVKPQRAMPRFEAFVSFYFTEKFRSLVYVKPNRFGGGKKPGFLAADWNPLIDGAYLMYPRDREAVLMIFDRRWDFPPSPVQWSVCRWLAAPLAMRREESTGMVALLMAPPEDCFAIATPYNKTPPDGVAGHQSLYLSLFGQDLAEGQTARAHSRLVVGKLSEQQAVEQYQQYLDERKRGQKK